MREAVVSGLRHHCSGHLAPCVTSANRCRRPGCSRALRGAAGQPVLPPIPSICSGHRQLRGERAAPGPVTHGEGQSPSLAAGLAGRENLGFCRGGSRGGGRSCSYHFLPSRGCGAVHFQSRPSCSGRVGERPRHQWGRDSSSAPPDGPGPGGRRPRGWRHAQRVWGLGAEVLRGTGAADADDHTRRGSAVLLEPARPSTGPSEREGRGRGSETSQRLMRWELCSQSKTRACVLRPLLLPPGGPVCRSVALPVPEPVPSAGFAVSFPTIRLPVGTSLTLKPGRSPSRRDGKRHLLPVILWGAGVALRAGSLTAHPGFLAAAELRGSRVGAALPPGQAPGSG